MKELFVSSVASGERSVERAVTSLVAHGFYSVELTGGHDFVDGLGDTLVLLQHELHAHFMVHNYFPPQRADFVLNLASLDPTVADNSMRLCREAIGMAQLLGSNAYSIHAGFYLDPKVSDLGKGFTGRIVASRDAAMSVFCERLTRLSADYPDMTFYLENNCYTQKAHSRYGDVPHSMLCTFNDFMELKENIPFKLLLDVAHLYVTSKSLGLSFEREYAQFVDHAEYIHISDNDGRSDLNHGLRIGSDICNAVSRSILHSKIITLEIYSGLAEVKNSYDLLRTTIQGN
ncbi:MAG: sugar phosphate isomerase/epimerase family protein [Desulfovibrionaceae bacterium]